MKNGIQIVLKKKVLMRSRKYLLLLEISET